MNHARQRQDAPRLPHKSPVAPQPVREQAPPQSIEAEQAVLGGLLLKPKAAGMILAALDASDFYLPIHGAVFQSARALHEAGRAIDIVTVSARLKAGGQLEQVGGRAYLATLAEAAVGTASPLHHAAIVRDKSRLRAFIAQSVAGIEAAYAQASSASEVVSRAQSDLQALAAVTVGRAEKMADRDELCDAFWRDYEWRQSIGGGIRTGLDKLDNRYGGLIPGEAYVIGGESSGGKTAFALNLLGACVARGHPALFFSVEMRREEIAGRLLAATAQIDGNLIRTCQLAEYEIAHLRKAEATIRTWPLHIYDDPFLKIDDFRDLCRTYHAEKGIRLVVLDYLQLVDAGGNGKREENRERELARLSRVCCGIAKDLGITVVMLSQLNDDGKIRESRAILHDANKVFIIKPWEADGENSIVPVTIKVEKNRSGPRGEFDLYYDQRTLRFLNPANVYEGARQ